MVALSHHLNLDEDQTHEAGMAGLLPDLGKALIQSDVLLKPGKLTPEELKLLVSLASDQLFRKEFIDPRMPGYKANMPEISLGKGLVTRLRLLLDAEAPKAP